MPQSLIKAMLVFSLAVTVISCDQDKTVDTPLDSLSQPATYVVKRVSTSETVSLETATKVAERFRAPQRKARSGESVNNTFTINDSEGNHACFVINYSNNGGFVIVSAKKDVEPILAYSETGNFSMEIMESTGASVIMEENRYLIEHADQLPDSAKLANRIRWEQLDYEEETLQLESSRSYDDVCRLFMSQQEAWEKAGYDFWDLAEFKKTSMFNSMSPADQQAIESLPYGNANKDYFGGIEHTTFVVLASNTSTSHVNQLFTTKWWPLGPYNKLVPSQRSLGCTTIAAGQIMRYHRYPAKYYWSNMPDDGATDATASFLYELAQKIGIDFTKNSGATIDQVKKAFNDYGYNATTIAHDESKVRSNILNKRPVYMRGQANNEDTEGHAWVCNGYHSVTSNSTYELWCLEDCPSGYEPTMFHKLYEWGQSYYNSTPEYYMNWGNLGNGDGWFIDSSTKSPMNHYQMRRQDIVDIYPR